MSRKSAIALGTKHAARTTARRTLADITKTSLGKNNKHTATSRVATKVGMAFFAEILNRIF